MKNVSRILLGLLAVATLSACGALGSKKMDSKEAAEQVVKTYQKNVDTANYKLIEIAWSEREELSNNMEYLYLTLVGTDGKLYSQAIKVGGDNQGPNEIEESRSSRTYDFATLKGLSDTDIKPETIAKQIENAKTQVPEEFNYKGVGRYTLAIDPATGEKNTTFIVHVTEKGNATSMQGRTIVTTYYEIEFYGQEDGTAIMEEME